MLSTEVQRSVRLKQKKKSTNISPYPNEAIERLARAFYPAILACWNSVEGQREFAAWQAEQAHHFPTGNALLYISLSSVVLIASFTNSAILNDRFAICNSRLLSTNQIVNCDGRVRPIQGRTLFLWLFLPSHKFALPLP